MGADTSMSVAEILTCYRNQSPNSLASRVIDLFMAGLARMAYPASPLGTAIALNCYGVMALRNRNKWTTATVHLDHWLRRASKAFRLEDWRWV